MPDVRALNRLRGLVVITARGGPLVSQDDGRCYGRKADGSNREADCTGFHRTKRNSRLFTDDSLDQSSTGPSLARAHPSAGHPLDLSCRAASCLDRRKDLLFRDFLTTADDKIAIAFHCSFPLPRGGRSARPFRDLSESGESPQPCDRFVRAHRRSMSLRCTRPDPLDRLPPPIRPTQVGEGTHTECSRDRHHRNSDRLRRLRVPDSGIHKARSQRSPPDPDRVDWSPCCRPESLPVGSCPHKDCTESPRCTR